MPFTHFSRYLIEKAGLTKADVSMLLPLMRSGSFKKGSFALKKGAICKETLFVEKGLLRTYTLDDKGKEHIIQFAPENWFTGDRGSIYFNDPAYFYIEAVEDTAVVFVSDLFIDTASEQSAAFRVFNKTVLHVHIRQLQQRIDQLLSASAEARYIHFVQQYPDLMLRVPQWMIASYLGITPESLSRVRKELAERNFKPY